MRAETVAEVATMSDFEYGFRWGAAVGPVFALVVILVMAL